MDDNQILNILENTRYITKENKQEAIEKTEYNSSSAIDYLKDEQIISDSMIGQAISEYYNVPYFDLGRYRPSSVNTLRVPEDIARMSRVLLFKEDDHKVYIATDNIDNIINQYDTEGDDKVDAGDDEIGAKALKKYIENLFHKDVEFGYSMSKDIESGFIFYKPTLAERFINLFNNYDRVIPEVVDEIIAESLDERVSDIHFEPQNRKEVRVRFRVDGVLQTIGMIPMEYYENILNLIKVQSLMRTDEHFIPQDGAIRYERKNGASKGEPTDVRVSVLPTINGEKIVMRILTNSMKSIDLVGLGMSQTTREIISAVAHKPFGLILVTGPTGSGKSTTLYSILKLINDNSKNITTIEDPVEYKIDGVNHIQVNSQTDLTFAKGLRSILRQDPNVILVGEIRDGETANICVNAALTGHMVFSTVHANDAEGTIPRLLNMSVDPFLAASTLELIVAQRLVRKVCPSCLYTYTTKRIDLEKEIHFKTDLFKDKEITLFKGKGCNTCNGTGYTGRVGLYQLMLVEPELKDLMVPNPSVESIRAYTRKKGMRSMFEDGLEKAKLGLTTIEEIMRVASPPEQIFNIEE